jgi:hypothetical protein
MALARVVGFDGVDSDRMQQLKGEVEGGERPEGLPATQFLLLHDADKDQALAIVFFDNEADYAQGDATLNAMPRGDTPGSRTSVTKYDVVLDVKA